MNRGWTYIVFISSSIFMEKSVSPAYSVQDAEFGRPYEVKDTVETQADDHEVSPSNGWRNLSASEFSMETILFPNVWESLVDAGRRRAKYNTSATCSEALREYAIGLQNKETWAIR
ncbi:hypothetical protein BaRGS_00025422, partial [Batillaria attramentaria]